MAAKKDRSLFTRKEAIGNRPWPNLPQQLLNLLARKPNLLQQIRYPGTTKSWRTSTRRCNSSGRSHWPQLYDLGDSDYCNSLRKTLPQFLNVYFRTEVYQFWYYGSGDPTPHFWDPPKSHFLGYCHNFLVTLGPNPSNFCIWEVSTRIYWRLPPWDVSVPFKFVTLSSSFKNHDSTVVVLTGVSSPALMVYSRGQEKYTWIKHEWTTADPFGIKNQSVQFTNIIGFEGKFYALSLQGTLAVMEEVNSRLEITTIGRNQAVPSVSSRYFKEYLLESEGEILLVFLIYEKSLGVVDKVEVFRLHFPRLDWIKVLSLKERALLLEKECCIWVNSSKTGCRGNCVYFTQSAANGWCIYDMESGCISSVSEDRSLIWNEPVVEE
ncbi:hypothetical protein BUALT_Bualt01G0135800 [Buddleja alternifolia]|uniref:KIB1-4 beta-propeller domain-containing protein n=1 Tax=Buddleja alternifolia TaxID=168488 RepID=A0AAV6YHB9_9LAMI|nr:hypothetical protein BUALT_Bualt01G0135800 [Buddleja alternifolia]